MGRYSIYLILVLITSSCILTKEQRLDRRANRKLERLTDKYPQLLVQDTIVDTVIVEVPEVKIDTVFKLSEDVSGVDSILHLFNDRLDSLTSQELSNEIKYYITNRQVIEDTIVHTEDGVTVKIWQEGNTVRYQVDKPAERIHQEVRIPYQKVQKAPAPTFWTRKKVIGALIILGCIFVAMFMRIMWQISKMK